ncbi:hypothetical protein HY498_02385 [Candidatus Woesearchaeota archaeon]|nr:hypothetical protein [Candidatus Woesearchaeota archaeon]
MIREEFKYQEALTRIMNICFSKGPVVKCVQPQIVKAIDLSFDIDSGIESIVNDKDTDIDEGFALLKWPFIGKFHLFMGRRNLMHQDDGNVYPFGYVSWLIENYNNFMNNTLSKKDLELLCRYKPFMEDPEEQEYVYKNLRGNIFAYDCGEASPEILLYRNGSNEIIRPLGDKKRLKTYSVPRAELSIEIEDLSHFAIGILERNLRFKESRRLAEWKEKLSEHVLK